MKASDLQLIQEYSGELGGVLTMPDLKVLFSRQGEPALYKKLEACIRDGILLKVKRGLYATPSASLEDISSRIVPDSYITTGSVLARAALIGSIPARRVQAAKVGRPRTYTCELGRIEHLSLKPELFFGFVKQGGVKVARPEKAFLDACYFFFKGRRFSFDLYADVDTADLDMELVSEYLGVYDSRFVSFFGKTWGVR
jgi:hypothetical protein